VSPVGHRLSPTEMVLLAARFALAFAFLFAGIRKLVKGNLGLVVERYRLLPKKLIRPVSLALPLVEVSAGSCLALGFLTAQTSALIGAMLALFSAAIVINLVRKRIIPCGCLGDESRTISWGIVARNLTLACAAFAVTASPPVTLSADGFLGWSRQPGSPADGTAVVLTVFLAFVCFRLWREGRRLWKLGTASVTAVNAEK
jgi:putative oxidoreductase